MAVGGIGKGVAKTTKIDGKDVEVSTAGIGSRDELTKPYDPVQTRNDLEAVHGEENVSSTTVPKKPHQASATRSDVVMDVYHIGNVIREASQTNPHFRSYLQAELKLLQGRFDFVRVFLVGEHTIESQNQTKW